MTRVDMHIELARCKMLYHGVEFRSLVELERLRRNGDPKLKEAKLRWAKELDEAAVELRAAKRNFLDPIEEVV